MSKRNETGHRKNNKRVAAGQKTYTRSGGLRKYNESPRSAGKRSAAAKKAALERAAERETTQVRAAAKRATQPKAATAPLDILRRLLAAQREIEHMRRQIARKQRENRQLRSRLKRTAHLPGGPTLLDDKSGKQ